MSRALTPKQAARYSELLLKLAGHPEEEPWTEDLRKRIGLTVKEAQDFWNLYWLLRNGRDPA